ncbi:MAG TPA: MFS transporter, partial [Chloroflexota bacterium]
MSEQAVSPRRAGIEVQASWLPMIIVAVAQIQMAFNVTGLPVSMGAIVHEFDTSPTSVGTALVLYSLMVAGFVMLGGKVGKRVGSRRVFQVSVLGHGVAMAVVALSVNLAMLFVAQLAAGLAAAALVPALVVMIATQYRGKQQAQALGFLGAARAMASTLAFFVAGSLAATVGWRFSFGLLLAVSVIVFMLSWRLKSAPPQPSVAIDWVGAALAAAAITLISLGFNFINSWGLLV